jgi:hypothetical protein
MEVRMGSQSPSRAATAGYRLLTLALAFVVAFTAFAFVSLGVGIARGGDSLLWGDTLTVPAELNPDSVRPLPDGVELSGWPHVSVEVEDPTTKQMALRSLMDLGPLLLFIGGLWLLRGVARSVTEGDPFGAPNVQRLRSLGFILVVGAPAVELLNTAFRESLFNTLPAHPSIDIGIAGFSLPGEAMVAGLGAFILAEVFAHGVRLREDVEGTV